MIETYRGVVYPAQIDHMGHMNVQWYTSKFDEATWQLFSIIGISGGYVRDNNKGMAALEQITKFRAEVFEGDVLLVRSSIVDVGDKIIRFLHVMFDAETDKLVAETEILGVHMDRDRRKSCPLPEFVKIRCKEIMEL